MLNLTLPQRLSLKKRELSFLRSSERGQEKARSLRVYNNSDALILTNEIHQLEAQIEFEQESKYNPYELWSIKKLANSNYFVELGKWYVDNSDFKVETLLEWNRAAKALSFLEDEYYSISGNHHEDYIKVVDLIKRLVSDFKNLEELKNFNLPDNNGHNNQR